MKIKKKCGKCKKCGRKYKKIVKGLCGRCYRKQYNLKNIKIKRKKQNEYYQKNRINIIKNTNKPKVKKRRKQYKKVYYEKNREYVISKVREYNKKEENKLRQKINAMNKRYGISIEYYKEMRIKQKNKCAICFKSMPKKLEVTNRMWNIDHDHKTGKVRGILCHSCNHMLGYLEKDDNLIKNAIKYLNKFI
jgi:NMD protein affecting ribosome stability and mRNA decay